jgi:hypothetical protein
MKANPLGGKHAMDTSYHPDKYWRYAVDREAKLRQFTGLTQQPLVTKTSAVTSLGSCFADHIRMFLKDNGYNYVVTEPNESGSSANWGRVYNPISLRQIVDYCNNPDWRPQERWWVDAQERTLDPYRAIVPYPDARAAAEDFQRHRALAREVFAAAEVVILTYGLVEVWESALDGCVFQARPVAFDPARHRFRILEYPECLQAIEDACAGIRRINPRSTIILTVSPVPLRATFRPDVTPVTANAYSKAVLLAAVQTASRRGAGAHYFPSYEIVMECVDEPFRKDGDVTPATVELVMSLFERSFVRR